MKSRPCRAVFTALLIVCMAACVFAQTPAVPSAYSGPATVNLSGMWEFRFDAEHRGEQEGWFASDSTAQRPEEGWQKLAVPGSFNEQLAKNPGQPDKSDAMRFATGTGWYRRTFPTPYGLAPGAHCFLHLSAAVMRDAVWLNGKPVGRSALPYLEVVYDITPLLRASGDNDLVVAVDNTVPRLGIPDNYWHGWWNDGGLIRPVYLEIRPGSYAQSHIVTSMGAKSGDWRLDIATSVHQRSSAAVTIGYELTDSAGHAIWRKAGISVPPTDAGVSSSMTLSKLQAWSPEHPVLYTLTTTASDGVTSDVTRIRVGFREIAVKGTQILLNGQPLQIRGITRHQFLAGAGMSMTVAEDRKDIADLKTLGANFVRLAHYSQSQDVYDACDELGLLVWTEIPAWQSNPESLADAGVWSESAEPQLRAMVEQHRDHPSVVVWSVANEIPSQRAEGVAYVAKAVAFVKSLDPSRLVTFASDRRLGDEAFGPVDIISVNEYFGWYGGKFDDVGPMLDQMHDKFPGKPVVVSEYGSEAVADWNPATAPKDSRDYSYAYQVAFLKAHMEQIYSPKRRGFVAGGIIWAYNDFPDPHRVGGDHPSIANYRNNKGIVTMDRTHKPSYAVVQDFFRKLAAQ